MEDIWDKIKDRNDADSFNLSASLKHDDANLDLSDKYNNAMSYFTVIFTASVVKYNARDVKD